MIEKNIYYRIKTIIRNNHQLAAQLIKFSSYHSNNKSIVNHEKFTAIFPKIIKNLSSYEIAKIMSLQKNQF